MFAGNFAPVGWFFCEGQLLPISEYDTLFVLIGTTYGGDGQETFALPDLRGRIPVHQGTGSGLTTRQIGETGGAEEITLVAQQIPSHSHALLASSGPGTSNNPSGSVFAESPSINTYIEDVTGVALGAQAVSSVGGSQPHTNFQPYLCLNFIISLYGIFPSPT